MSMQMDAEFKKEQIGTLSSGWGHRKGGSLNLANKNLYAKWGTFLSCKALAIHKP